MKVTKKLYMAMTLGLFALSNLSLACDCVNPEDIKFDESSDSIFVGRVESKLWSFLSSNNKYRFKVQGTILGDEHEEIVFWSGKQSSTCGAQFKKDTDYLISVSNVDNKKIVSVCSAWELDSTIGQKMLNKLTNSL